MYSIILFVGLPGSGKTYWARKMCDVVVDDITDMAQLPPSDKLEWRDLGITDVNFCNPGTIEKATDILKGMYPSHTIGVSYFANDPEQCRENVRLRNDGRQVEETIRKFAKIYKPPLSARKVWKAVDSGQGLNQ